VSDCETKGFEDEVRACVEEIKRALPALADHHTPLVVLAALSEHVGGGLQLCQAAGVCTPEQAREVLRRLAQIAFAEAPPH
jgi:hypothetical protein